MLRRGGPAALRISRRRRSVSLDRLSLSPNGLFVNPNIRDCMTFALLHAYLPLASDRPRRGSQSFGMLRPEGKICLLEPSLDSKARTPMNEKHECL